MRKILILFMATVVLAGCGYFKSRQTDQDKLNLTSRFKTTWNIHEYAEHNSDGTITYHALPWGGLVGSVKEHNLPVDWSEYESISFEFAEPTKVATQIIVASKLLTGGKRGITTLTCNFDGQDVTCISDVALQAASEGIVKVKRVYLTPATSYWKPDSIWGGQCAFGNWTNGFVIKSENFSRAKAGDKLEFLFTTDKSNPEVKYWLFKTIYNGTDKTLQGNQTELNQWGCASVGERSTVYRIVLTADDVVNLQKTGLFVNGYYNIVTRCNLLRKMPKVATEQQASL